ncbi:hypothetical protein NE237_004824 [Protea cynaroides]|uniref:DC1 domain-containing protein n=1 Tax=Protea cynaroides TaxID=273540 RepID=A0A9Q0QTP5_9MAGN|nr:hypothetical protein NE237_004824 [Protea cynaroides]
MAKPKTPPPNATPQMGKPNGSSSIHHFSHPHPLELQVSNGQQAAIKVSCSGCKLSSSGTFYVCKPCNYFLHISCSQMAQRITHPADPNHTLSLLPVPAYPEGHFNCDACGRSGNGFSYHCQTCNMDIHTLCALMPLSVNHQSHHHPLTLIFSPPYQDMGFSCDICQQMGSNHWLYRCNSCGFDAHVGCARTKPKTPPPQTQTQIQTQTQQIYQPTTVERSVIPQNQNGSQFGSSQGNGFASNLFQNVLTGVAPQFGKKMVQNTSGQGGHGQQTQTQPIYQPTVKTRPIYQQPVQRTGFPQSIPPQAQTQTQPIYQPPVQRTGFPQSIPPQAQTQTRPIYQQPVQRTAFPQSIPPQAQTQTRPIYQQPVQRIGFPQSITPQVQTQTRPIYQQPVQGTGFPQSIPPQAQTQTRPIYQQPVQGTAFPRFIPPQTQTQTQPIYPQTMQKPAIPQNQYGPQGSEEVTDFGQPNEVVYEASISCESRGETTDFGNPDEVVNGDASPEQRSEEVTWTEEVTDFSNPDEVVNGDASPEQRSEEVTWTEEVTEYGHPNEVGYGDPRPEERSEQAWTEEGTGYGHPNEVVYGDSRPEQRSGQAWTEEGTQYGQPNEVVYGDPGPEQRSEQAWTEEGTQYGHPNEVMYGDAGHEQMSEQVTWTKYGHPTAVMYGHAGHEQITKQETIELSASWNEVNPDYGGGNDCGAYDFGGDFSSSLAETDGGYADGSGNSNYSF